MIIGIPKLGTLFTTMVFYLFINVPVISAQERNVTTRLLFILNSAKIFYGLPIFSPTVSR